jgi:hypothetical protein
MNYINKNVMNKAEILKQTGLSEEEFYKLYPTPDSYFKRGGTRKQMGGQQEQEQLMAMIQAYAEANQIDPQDIMQQLQEADPETQQQMLQQMMQEMQGIQNQEPEQPSISMGEEFAMPETNPYADEEQVMQQGGSSKGQGTYMNKTSNFIEWLKNKSTEANQQNMMENESMMKNYMQWGGGNKYPLSWSPERIKEYEKDKQAQAEDYYFTQYNNMVKTVGKDKANKVKDAFYNKPTGTPAKMFGIMSPDAIQNSASSVYLNNRVYDGVAQIPIADGINPNGGIYKGKVVGSNTQASNSTPTFTVNGNLVDNTDPAYQSSINGTNTSTGGWTTYDDSSNSTNAKEDNTTDDWKTKYEQLANQVYGRQNYYGGYGYGAPHFNLYGNPLMGLFGGLYGLGTGIASLFQGRGARNNMSNREQGLRNSPNNDLNKRKPKSNEPNTIGLKWPKQQKERDAFDKHVGNDKEVRSDYATYRDTDEQKKALQDRIAKEEAIKNLGRFKNRPKEYGGLIKAQDGISFNPADYYDPSKFYSEEDYNYPTENRKGSMLNPPVDSPAGNLDSSSWIGGDVWETGPNPKGIQSTWKDIQGNNLFDKAQKPKVAPKKTDVSWGFSNPWAADEMLNGVQSLTAYANDAQQANIDRKQRQKMSDVNNKQANTNEINRGDWLGSSGLAYGMFRPDQDIYSGPNAYAKKGGTWFNNNFYQIGGEESGEEYPDNEYNEGDELYMTDEEIQRFIDQGGTLDFID